MLFSVLLFFLDSACSTDLVENHESRFIQMVPNRIKIVQVNCGISDHYYVATNVQSIPDFRGDPPAYAIECDLPGCVVDEGGHVFTNIPSRWTKIRGGFTVTFSAYHVPYFASVKFCNI